VARRSAEYWKRRAEARLVAIERGTEPYLGRIYRINSGVVNSIREDIERIIGSFAKHAQLTRDEAISLLGESISEIERQRIIAMCSGIENKATKARLMAKVNAPAYRARIDRLLAIEVSAQARMALLAPKQIDIMTAGLHMAGTEMFNRTIFDLQRGTGLGFSFAGVTDKQIESVMREAWSGGHYSKRVWRNTQVIAGRIRDTVEKNMITGKSWRRCLNAVEDQALIDSNYAASRILRTETAYVANEMEAEAYEEAGLDEYQYVATLDGKTSTICRGLDGKKFKLKDRETGKNYPPMHPHCRSTTVAVISGFDMSELQRRARDPEAGETYKVPANMTYEEWRRTHATIKPGINIVGVQSKTPAINTRLFNNGPKNNIVLKYNSVPKNYRNTIMRKFNAGADEAKELYKKFVQDDSLFDANYTGISHYSPTDRKIRLDIGQDAINPCGIGAAYFHEHGHYIDHAAGWVSHNADFGRALREDLNDAIFAHTSVGKSIYQAEMQISQDICGDAKSSVSDIFQGLTRGRIMGDFGHRLSYWSNNWAVETEAFANFYEAQFSVKRYNIIKKYFPKGLTEFERIIKGLI
jgi:SPP1 gp7 family putative phage head morphogenesis protein